MQKKPEQKPATIQNKYINYKTLINSYYDKGSDRSDLQQVLKQVTPDVEILNTLIQFEKKIDALVRRKRFDLQELYMRAPKKFKKVMRVHIINEVDKQAHRLKIKGYLFPSNEQLKQIKFTSFFKQIGFRFSNEAYTSTVWKKSQPNALDKDGIIINLNSNQKSNLQVSFLMLNNPPKFKIDPYLQKIVKMESGTRIAILQAIWQYIKMHKLQDVENKQIINTDEAMKNAFKCEKMPFSSINGRIRQLLTPSDPININLVVNDKNDERIYDFIVEVEGRPRIDVMPFLAQKASDDRNQKSDNPFFFLNQKIKKIDKAIQDHTQKLRRHAYKRQIYKNYNQNTIEQIVKQQHQLLKQMLEQDKKEDVNSLDFLLENQEQVEKEIKNYFDQLSTPKAE